MKQIKLCPSPTHNDRHIVRHTESQSAQVDCIHMLLLPMQLGRGIQIYFLLVKMAEAFFPVWSTNDRSTLSTGQFKTIEIKHHFVRLHESPLNNLMCAHHLCKITLIHGYTATDAWASTPLEHLGSRRSSAEDARIEAL